MFTDTHCHIYKEYYEDIESLMDEINKSKINRVINNGVDNKSNIEVLEMLGKYNFMYGTLGIHPENVEEYTQEDLAFIEEHINDDMVLAIGEIGLDYYWVKDNKEKQKELFESQLELAEKYNKPVVIHSREATQDTIEILGKYNVRGVIHSFSGSYETACIYIKMGFLLGVNGVITFKNCNLKDVISRIDLSNILLETDSPYLTPVPYRGQRNDPTHVFEVAEFIADLKNISIDELSEITNANVKRLFDI